MFNLSTKKIRKIDAYFAKQSVLAIKKSVRNYLRKTESVLALVSISLLLSVQNMDAQVYAENNGLVVMEVESMPIVGVWQKQTTKTGFSGSGYYFASANFTSSGGTHTLTYKFLIKTAGVYQIQVRSIIAEGTSTTDCNDSWLRLVNSKNTALTPVANSNAISNTWLKYYQNKLAWTWQTSNKDNDPKSIAYDLAAGEYAVQLSMRSKGHAIDKIVLWNRAKQTLGNAVTGEHTAEQNTNLNALPVSSLATAIERIDKSENSFSITQPTAGNIVIANPFANPFNVRVLSLSGQVLHQQSGIGLAEYSFNASSGLVIVQLSNGLQSLNKKLFIQ